MPEIRSPIPTAYVPSGSGTLRAASMMRCARCDISQVPSGPGLLYGPHPAAGEPRAAYRGTRSGSVQATAHGTGSSEARAARDHGDVSTRTLLILAAITGVAILAAGAIQILLAR